jgi:hypothetical protein
MIQNGVGLHYLMKPRKKKEMTHQEIQDREIIERYARRQLAPDERRAFQEHYFECDQCFERAQVEARFIAAVRQASRKGLLAEGETEPVRWWASLLTPAFGAAAAAALLLAVIIGWLALRQPMAPRPEIARQERPSPSPNQAPNQPGAAEQNTAQGASPTPERNDRPKPPKLEDQRDLLAQNRPPEESPSKLPFVLLESSRDTSAGGNQLTLPANATAAILRIEIEPGASFTSFQCQVLDSARRLVTIGAGGKASSLGSVAVRAPATTLQDGKYLVRCYGLHQGQRQLIGEYDLRVRKQ